jgi:hypothetical protein
MDLPMRICCQRDGTTHLPHPQRSVPRILESSKTIFALLLLAACNAAAAQGWEIRYSTGVSLTAHVEGQEFSFDFPRSPGSVNYVTKPETLAAGVAASATFTITTAGDPVFDYHTAANNTCDSPATVRLFLQRQGDNLSGAGQYEFYRWWANAGTVLKEGTFTVSVPLQPSLWTSVFGKKGDANPRAFAAAIADLGNVGVTFGGGCFYGHGVRILNGRAVFTMNRFAVQ